MPKLLDPQKQYLVHNRDKFGQKAFLIDAFMVTEDRVQIDLPNDALAAAKKPVGYHTDDATLSEGEIVVTKPQGKDKEVHYLHVQDSSLHYLSSTVVANRDFPADPPLNIYGTFMMEAGDIINYPKGPSAKTTAGRFVFNQRLLVEPFGDVIEYINTRFNIKVIERHIAKLMLEKVVTPAQCKKYLNYGHALAHFSELGVPTQTPRSMTTDPQIPVVKAQLIEKYKDKLHDPLIINLIENELIAMDRKWLEGDRSLGFIDGIGSKAMVIHRKKLFVSVGGIESFDKDVVTYDFVKNSLTEGWDPRDFPAICNEIRKGVYSRGKETQKGGAQTKQVTRAFRDVAITEDDCQTNRVIEVVIQPALAAEFIGQFVKTGKDQFVKLTDKNINSYTGHMIQMRSPLECQTQNGFCHKCCGENTAILGVGALSMEFASVTSTFTKSSLKNMHGTKLSVVPLHAENFFSCFVQ